MWRDFIQVIASAGGNWIRSGLMTGSWISPALTQQIARKEWFTRSLLAVQHFIRKYECKHTHAFLISVSSWRYHYVNCLCHLHRRKGCVWLGNQALFAFSNEQMLCYSLCPIAYFVTEVQWSVLSKKSNGVCCQEKSDSVCPSKNNNK